MEEKKEFVNEEKTETVTASKQEADAEASSGEKLVQALQIGVVAIYTLATIWTQVRAMQKQAAKIREVQAKARGRYEKAKYRQKTKNLKKSPKSRRFQGI